MYKEYGPLYLDDFPTDDSNQELMLQIINILPDYIKGLIIQWDCSDTEVRESIFKFLCMKIGFENCEQYYKSDIAKNYFEKHIFLSEELINKILDK